MDAVGWAGGTMLVAGVGDGLLTCTVSEDALSL